MVQTTPHLRIAFRGRSLLGRAIYNKDAAFTDDERDWFGLHGLLPAHVLTHRGPARARAGARPAQGGRPREVHRPGRPPGPQRDALLPPPRRAPRGVPPDRLHADGRARLPGVQPHHSAAAGRLDHPRRRRPDPRAAPQRGPAGRPAHRRDRQRADPRPWRPGRRRDGDPGRQARHLHRRRGDQPGPRAADLARRGHGQPGAAGRPAVRRLAGAPPAGPRLRRVHRFLRGGRADGLPPGAGPVGGLQAAHRDRDPRPLPRRPAVVQRRHPGDGRGRGGRDPRRPAAPRCPGLGPALRLRRRRRRRDRHRAAHPAGAPRGGSRRARDRAVARAPRFEGPAQPGAARARGRQARVRAARHDARGAGTSPAAPTC